MDMMTEDDMSLKKVDVISVEQCVAICRDYELKYAGLQVSRITSISRKRKKRNEEKISPISFFFLCIAEKH